MKKIVRPVSRQVAFELKLGYLMPVFLGLAILINTQIVNASALRLRDFAPIAIHPSRYANYSRDTLDLQFAPIHPSIIGVSLVDGAPNIQPKGLASEVPALATVTLQPVISPTSAGGSPQPTSTPIIPTPTLPLPTLPPLLPTLPPLIPTLPPVVPMIPTAVAPVIDLVPTIVPSPPCIPIPLVRSCN